MLQRMGTAALTLSLLLASGAAGVFGQQDAPSSVLARARDAVGGETRLRAVNSLSLNAQCQTGRWEYTGDGNRIRLDPYEGMLSAELKIELPDKFLLRRWIYGAEVLTALDGQRLVMGTRRAGEFKSALASEKSTPAALAMAQREFLRYLVAWLLSTPPHLDVKFSDLGETVTNARPMDVVEAIGAYDFYARLFFDKETHLLATVAFDEPPAPRRRSTSSEQPGHAPLFTRIEPPPAAQQPTPQTESRTRRGDLNDVQRATPEQYGGSVVLQLLDYRSTGGILMPRRLVIDAGSIEEWQIGKLELNPKIDPRDFAPR